LDRSGRNAVNQEEIAEGLMKSLRIALLFSVGAVAACAPRQAPPPPPPPVATPLPRPVAPPSPPPPAADWNDLALTPGSWTYRGEAAASLATYGGAAGSFTLRCDRNSRQVTLSRSGITTGNTMTIRTSSTARNLPLSVQGEPTAVFARLSASDRLLDAVVFSRGRFTVEVPGTQMMIIPAWPEPARVVEDCRF
jgi:hypothetical protein